MVSRKKLGNISSQSDWKNNMDKFKEKLFDKVGPGGLKCKCCNSSFTGNKHHSSKHKKKYTRIARRKINKQKEEE